MSTLFKRNFDPIRRKTLARPRALIIAVLVLLGCGLYYYKMLHAPGGFPPGMGPGGMAALVDAAKVGRKPIYESITAVGTLLAQESVVLRPEISGVVEKTNFEEGQDVKQGQLLISIENAVQAAGLAQAQANLALAEANSKRSQMLGRTGATSQQNVDAAKAQLAVTTANVAAAKAQFEKTQLRAPFTGRIGILKVNTGNWVSAGTELVTLEMMDPLKLDFSVPELFLRNMQIGMPVEIMVDALGRERFSGKITVIEPRVDERTRTLKIRAEIDNKDFKLRPGLFVRASVAFNNAAQPLSVPEAAIVPMADKSFVFKISDGKVKNTEVKTGLRNAGFVEIISGLNENDEVVTAGQMRLKDAMPVTVRGAAPPQGTPAQRKGT